MQHLFKVWGEVASRLKSAKHILLICDYDGTLTPIVDRPELAILSEKTRGSLHTLARDRRYTVGVVSGRALSDLKSKVKVKGIFYAGNHGLEIEGTSSSFLSPVAEELRPMVQVLGQVLSIALSGIKGVFVEDKGLTLSVHYRQVVDELEESKAKRAFDGVVAPLHNLGKVQVTRGKKVYEIRPPTDWNKGKAITWLLARCRGAGKKGGALPVFLGDDLTDEDGFKVVKEMGGISIFVGEEYPRSMAYYFLDSPRQVNEFLERLIRLK